MEINQKFEKGLRLMLLIVEGGTEILRDLLTYCIDTLQNKQTLAQYLNTNKPHIDNLKTRGKIFVDQYELLFPKAGDPDINKWDITLLSLILNNYCKKMEDTVTFIRKFRNKCHGHISTIQISDTDFKLNWDNMTSAIDKITAEICQTSITDKYNDMVDKFKNDPLDQSVINKVLNKCKAEGDVKLLEQIIDDFLQEPHSAFTDNIKRRITGKLLQESSTTGNVPILRDEEYNVFLVHSTIDSQKAMELNDYLLAKGYKTYAHCKQGWKDFGKPIFDAIVDVESMSQTVLIVLTPNSLESDWVALETILAIETSLAEQYMCMRLALTGFTGDQTSSLKELSMVPCIDLDGPNWKGEILTELNVKYKMESAFPAINLAHGLVFNYFVGYLKHVLPGLEKRLQAHELYRDNQTMMSMKLHILLPESCRVFQFDGEFGDFCIQKEDSLKIIAKHGDKDREYTPCMYSITKRGLQKKRYFMGECPFIMDTMAKLSKYGFVENFNPRLQVVRFRQTLEDLVNRRNNEVCNETVMFVDYNDRKTSHAEEIWKSLEFELSAEVHERESPSKLTAIFREGREKCWATIANTVDGKDSETAEKIVDFLTKQKSCSTRPLKRELSDKARWKLFVVSMEAVTDPELTKQYDNLVSNSIEKNKVQVIPIIAAGTDISVIPKKYRWTIMLNGNDADYLEKLWETMEGRNIKMSNTIRPVSVYEGLAWTYMLNYLPVALLGKTEDGKELKERFQDAIEKYKTGCKCITRVFVIVPITWDFEPSRTLFEGEEHLGAIEPVVVGERKYLLQLYRLTLKTGKKVCYAREFATPAIALYEMAKTFPFAGMDRQEMCKQLGAFADLVEKIIHQDSFIKIYGVLEDKCKVVRFNDQWQAMTNALEEKLVYYLYTNEYIQPKPIKPT